MWLLCKQNWNIIVSYLLQAFLKVKSWSSGKCKSFHNCYKLILVLCRTKIDMENEVSIHIISNYNFKKIMFITCNYNIQIKQLHNKFAKIKKKCVTG